MARHVMPSVITVGGAARPHTERDRDVERARRDGGGGQRRIVDGRNDCDRAAGHVRGDVHVRYIRCRNAFEPHGVPVEDGALF